MTIADWVSVLVPAMTVVAWLFRLEGAQKTSAARHEALKEDVDEVRDDVRYIRDRIDRALNGR